MNRKTFESLKPVLNAYDSLNTLVQNLSIETEEYSEIYIRSEDGNFYSIPLITTADLLSVVKQTKQRLREEMDKIGLFVD